MYACDFQERKHQIVVVAEGVSREEVTPELKKLDAVPSFSPILRSSANIPTILESDLLEKLDTKAVNYFHSSNVKLKII